MGSGCEGWRSGKGALEEGSGRESEDVVCVTGGCLRLTAEEKDVVEELTALLREVDRTVRRIAAGVKEIRQARKELLNVRFRPYSE